MTGSANLMVLPTVADSLAGRMETQLLLPLSQSEIENRSGNWVDGVFSGEILEANPPAVGEELIGRVLRGGYPEAVARPTARRRIAWARQYIDAIVQRDIRDVAEIDKLDRLPHFLHLLSQVAGQMCNYSEWGGQLGLDGKTVSRYIGVFEHMYLLKRIDTWAHNRLKRIIKTPKLQFIDSGLLAMLMNVAAKNVEMDKNAFGHVLESFVFSELFKHATASDVDYRLLYYRDADKYEVDIVIENMAGQLVGIEVKASATIKERDLRGLKKLSVLARDRFVTGVLLYDGDETMPLGDDIWAAPLSTLWGS